MCHALCALMRAQNGTGFGVICHCLERSFARRYVGPGRQFFARAATSAPREPHSSLTPLGWHDGVPQTMQPHPIQPSPRSHVHVTHSRLGQASHDAYAERSHTMNPRVNRSGGRHLHAPEYSPRHGFPTSLAMGCAPGDDMTGPPTVRRSFPSPPCLATGGTDGRRYSALCGPIVPTPCIGQIARLPIGSPVTARWVPKTSSTLAKTLIQCRCCQIIQCCRCWLRASRTQIRAVASGTAVLSSGWQARHVRHAHAIVPYVESRWQDADTLTHVPQLDRWCGLMHVLMARLTFGTSSASPFAFLVCLAARAPLTPSRNAPSPSPMGHTSVPLGFTPIRPAAQ
jgi:hypothetical protein